MRSFTYPIRVSRDRAGRYLITFPDLPRCATDGRTVAEALDEAADALEEAIAHRIAQGLEIPPPSRLKKGRRAVSLSAQMSAKAALYLALRTAGISQSALARRLDVGEAEVRRMLNPRHNTRLRRLEQALAALGQRLVVHAEAA
ncbi:MAG TPA: type II toxin-antitoxin system HicB family antitoxin [Candidatus Kryptonia bacterium]|nr:type II toxin-antitoxin system HicB family antitoxin [Candidatus Kryptonia bacterium]